MANKAYHDNKFLLDKITNEVHSHCVRLDCAIQYLLIKNGFISPDNSYCFVFDEDDYEKSCPLVVMRNTPYNDLRIIGESKINDYFVTEIWYENDFNTYVNLRNVDNGEIKERVLITSRSGYENLVTIFDCLNYEINGDKYDEKEDK